MNNPNFGVIVLCKLTTNIIEEWFIMSENQNQGCIKCGHTEVEEGTLSATGSGLSKFLDVQHNNFKTITCKIVDIPNFINKIETEVETLLICSLEDKSK